MRFNGTDSWRVATGGPTPAMSCALWIRAAERLLIPADPLVPGPLDIDRPPAPISAGDEEIAKQWLGWWRSLMAPLLRSEALNQFLDPAEDTIDPLGLAPYPILAELTILRWPQVMEWQISRQGKGFGRHNSRAPLTGEVVREFERAQGRQARPFSLDFVLLPVRDEVIRNVDGERYLIPEQVYFGPAWEGWLRDLVAEIG